jgi:hypothetical protein
MNSSNFCLFSGEHNAVASIFDLRCHSLIKTTFNKYLLSIFVTRIHMLTLSTIFQLINVILLKSSYGENFDGGKNRGRNSM